VPEGTITQVLVISNYRFSPERLPVVPGSAVLVRNEDHVAHTVTSAAAPGALEFGAVNGVAFDTPPFLGDSTISIPAEAPVGTIVPYFCRMHGAAMLNRGELEIVAPP
jgi:plastocyanin